MKFRYLSTTVQVPIPSLGGSLIRSRPIIAARVIGPFGTQLIDGLLDTGSDDTILEEWVASLIGVDLTQAVHRDIGLVGRVQPVRVHYASVRIRLTDGLQITYEWPAVVGFTQTKLRFPLFGYAGFMQFFTSEFDGEQREVALTANKAFPGLVTSTSSSP